MADELKNFGSNSGEPPRRYIRTLEGDRQALEKGGVPDLVPFEKSGAVSGEEPGEAPAARPPAPAITTPASPPPPLPTFTPTTPAPTPLPKPPPPTERPVPIETYSGDFSARMKTEGASAVTVLAAEQDAAPAPVTPMPTKQSRGGILYVIGGFLLLLVGVGGAYFAYTRYLTKIAPVALAPVVSAPIFVDERAQVTGTSTILLQQIEDSVSKPLADGAVRFLYEENSTTTDNSVFSALILPAPGILLRNINAVGSMAGVVNAGGNQFPFFILSVSSYGDTFSGMLTWEPSMPRDLTALFPPITPAATMTAASTTATSTPSAKKPAAATTTPAAAALPTFKDVVIANHDARAYQDAAGNITLVYGYWNQKTLVIARDAAAFTELITRLATSRAQR